MLVKAITFVRVTAIQHSTKSTRERYAIIVAGGKGQRMGAPIPKQFLLLDKKPVLYYAIRAFLDAFPDMHIVLVHAVSDQKLIDHVRAYFPGERIELIPGGETRFHSVKNGLSAVKTSSVVFIHDGVRPLLTPKLIHKLETEALEKGNAVPALELKESIRRVKGASNTSEDRTAFRAVQTPQTFLSEIVLHAFLQPFDPGFTDEASVVEKAGTPIHLVEGEDQNLKITRPLDLVLAEMLLQERSEES